MTEIKLDMSQLQAELKKLSYAEGQKMKKAIDTATKKTVLIDADRWVQWSIRGGGWTGQVSVPTTKKPRKAKPKGKKPPSLLSRLLAALGGRSSPRSKQPRAPKKPAKPPTPKPPVPYRVPIDTGQYAASWRGHMVGDVGLFYAAARPPVKATVIEHGRRPGKGVPIDPLADWVKRKLGVKDRNKARSVAFAISKSIKAKGKHGLKVLERARPKILDAHIDNVERELKKLAGGD